MSTRHPAGLPAALLGIDRTLIVGVLNVTPDSFSDGGRYRNAQAAIEHGIALQASGADFVDVGGESTRPGAERVAASEEEHRVLAVVSGLKAAGVPTSIDTMRATTAVAAVAEGAFLINDVSGGLADPDMYGTVASLGVPYVVMHWRGHSTTMQSQSHYDNVVDEVRGELQTRVFAALEAGIEREAIVLDPGLGFAKEADHNWALLHSLKNFIELGFPVLLGASRKRFLGGLLAAPDGSARPVDQRDVATDAISALAAAAGVWAVRVHDVPGSADAVRVGEAWKRGRG
ncbi:MAG: dihydropteroate synthase [Actinomycetota bacterium]|nr:dihydropteroate synthase [Actinomycetota bacterium]